jgi:uncharacterized membrane protein YfcA
LKFLAQADRVKRDQIRTIFEEIGVPLEIILFLAGFLGGIMNSLAGGGSGLTYTALIFAGLPPITANATNTFAATIGYISGCAGYRQHIFAARHQLIWQVPLAGLGGLTGGWLLLNTQEAVFSMLVPWLLLMATILFWLAPAISRTAAHAKYTRPISVSVVILFIVFVYGGYFQAGFGIITLAALALTGHSHIGQMNGLKLTFAAIASLAAIFVFAYAGSIDWTAGTSVMIGIALGSYIAARISDRVPDRLMKFVISAISIGVTGYFFWDVYAK